MDRPATGATPLPDHVRDFLTPPRIGVLATAGADGEPHQAAIWFRLEPDGTILVNSREPRRWPADLRRDGRASLAVMDAADGLRWVGLGCTVVHVEYDVERSRDDIVALAHRYDDRDPGTEATFRSQPRVSFRLRVDRVHDHLAG